MGPQLDLNAPDVFRQAEVRAEWLIALLRLGISTSLAVLLVFLILAADVELTEMLRRQVWFALVTMGSYFVLGLGFALVIRAGAFRPWMAWPSALSDCLFILLGLHLSIANLELSAEYLWAFPTVWLMPVVLACGALRFNPALQATMAAVLVAGVLTILPLRIDGVIDDGDNLVDFLFGLPPNLMRLAMVALAGFVLVFASVLIRRLLRGFIAEVDARRRLTRFLPRQVEAQLQATDLDVLRQGVAETMAVLFIDIRGFSRTTEQMVPADVSQFLGGFRRCVTHAADAHGGIVDKFIGDAALVVFDNRDGRAADRALDSAEAMLAGVAAWRQDLRVGIGVHLGDVFAGVVGDAGRLEFTVLGDTVNVASRLEGATKTAEMDVLASDALWQAAHAPRVGWVSIARLDLPGRARPVAAWGRYRTT